MPLFPSTDRQNTVSYAIDLLRAHQIRRENASLHQQLKTCLSEIASLRNEVRDANQIAATVQDEIKNLKASSGASDSTAQKALALFDQDRALLKKQGREVVVIQQSCTTMQSDISNLKISTTEIQNDRQAKTTVLENQLQALKVDCQNLAATQQRQAHHMQITFESFQTALDEKADASVIESLEQGLDELRGRPSTLNTALPPVSHVSESVQVRDSQHRNDDDEIDAFPEPSNPRQAHHKPAETVPDDLDLDANAHTISYAGHHQYIPKQNDSLAMLPPSTAQATQLARVKTLRQKRFDGWMSYYDQAQKLLENLPSSFEETIVHNFVDGIFKDAHKRQCRQWLDLRGWNWANVTAFGELCSQVDANNEHTIKAVARTRESVTPERQMQDMLTAAAVGAPIAAKKPIRRSQRIAEMNSQIVHPQNLLVTDFARVSTDKGTGTIVNDKLAQRSTSKTQAPPATTMPTHDNTRMPPAASNARKRAAEPIELQRPPKRHRWTAGHAESSNDEGFLQPSKRANSAQGSPRRGRPIKYHAYGAERKHKREKKHQRLPLPPPPEIPILDTTEEE